ncbi:flavodoxin reductase [Flavobacterium sp. UBA6031]|uniref:flavodoxin reductase n=1 Tax=Flavobacterium sp. UBA6031 TaxID=1946551 RepID=UPI0025BEEA06|nr:flavodoxin reductase [Flavobacterium sp. UBA6031]
MKQYFVKIISIKHITHDVLQLVTEKPEEFNFIPGQATHISINEPDWKVKKNPFTMTCLPEDDFLEFIIKTYPEHKGVTNEILKLKEGAELILHDVFGSIAYKGEGVFIAGGAGVTPFISIFRDLQIRNETGKNKLIFANKMKRDIILKNEFEDTLGRNFVNILSDEQVEEYVHGQITEGFLEEYVNHLTKHVYVCGPPPMMEAVLKQLSNLGVPEKAIVVETF